MKAAIYTRCSTIDQDTEVQRRICEEYCQRQGIDVYRVYDDLGVSGMKDSRPAFNELQRDLRLVKFNCVVVTKLDRMGRSLQHLLSILDELAKWGVNFIAVSQQIDTTSAAGRFQMQVLGAFAEFERNIISERTKEALKYNKRVGKRGPDKKPRKKRGVLRTRLNLVEKEGR